MIPKINLILGLICKHYLSKQSIHDTSFNFMPVMLGGENPQCQIPEVQSLVSNFTLYGNLISGLLSAVTSPKLGSLSDRYGRAKVMACMILGLLVSETVTLLTATFPDILPVQLLLLGFLFDGLAGSFTAGMAVTFAYASDCTPPARRKVVFGWLHGCLFGGFALGPILGGYIVKASGKIVTIFYITLACHCAFFLFLAFLLPESLTRQRQVAARGAKYTGVGMGLSLTWVSYIHSCLKGSNLLEPLKILYPTGAGSSHALRRNLVLLAAVDTAMFGVAMGSMTVVIIYSEYIFHWGNFETNVFISIVNIFRVLVLLLLLPLISRVFQSREPRTSLQQNSGSDTLDLSIIRVAVFFDLVGYIGYATVKIGPLFILSGTIASIGGMGPPTLSAALTKHVPQDRTGEVLGAMGLLHALARVVAPTIFNLIYSLTVANTPQTIFICLSAVFGTTFVLSWFIRPHGMYYTRQNPSLSGPRNNLPSFLTLNISTYTRCRESKNCE